MIRKAFHMDLFPQHRNEYETRHNPIWPELAGILKSHGVHNYSIFVSPEGDRLFGYVEVENEERWKAVRDTPVCQKWWAYMSDVMPTNLDNSPRSVALQEVFHLS